MVHNINKLEQLFSENFASPSYIILATYYYQQRLFDYAQKVCEIGLKHDSSNIDGNYMMAKLFPPSTRLLGSLYGISSKSKISFSFLNFFFPIFSTISSSFILFLVPL